jgi:ATP-dependent Lon protease
MELPLFPLNTVLCPGIALPLHIFEDRYRALVRHCIDTTSPFGVVLIREGREVGTGGIKFTGIGTIAEIRDAGRYEDGRYDLLVVGTRRFEIREVLGAKRPYLVADVDVLDEHVGNPEVAQRLAMTATRRFVTYLELLQPRSGETAEEIDVRVEVETEDDDDADDDEAGTAVESDDDGGDDADADADVAEAAPRKRRVTIPDDPTVLSYLLAGIVQVESPRRQALLEASTSEARLRALLSILDRETLLLERRLRLYRPEVRLQGPRRS